MRRWFWLTLLAALLVACGSAGAEQRAADEPQAAAAPATAPPPTAAPPTETQEPEETVTPTPEPTAPADMEAEPPEHLRPRTRGWRTDWSKHTVPLDELFSGGVARDQIPPIDEPRFHSIEETGDEVAPNEPVVVVEHAGDARAYPLAILIWHEIVNDEVGGLPVSVTYCPLCNTALAFDRTVGGQVLSFGTSGLLRHSDLVMWDRQTESLWQQVTGEAIVGELAGTQLDFLPASLVSYDEFRQAYPEGQVLSRVTGHLRQYGSNPYSGYDNINREPFLFRGEADNRLPAMERVVGVTVGDSAVAYPFSELGEVGVINDQVGEQPVTIFSSSETLSALDTPVIRGARAIGSAVAYDPTVEGERLLFEMRDGHIIDTATGSRWDVTGHAVEGPLAGTQLAIVPHANHFWFAFAAFFPDTAIWTAG